MLNVQKVTCLACVTGGDLRATAKLQKQTISTATAATGYHVSRCVSTCFLAPVVRLVPNGGLVEPGIAINRFKLLSVAYFATRVAENA